MGDVNEEIISVCERYFGELYEHEDLFTNYFTIATPAFSAVKQSEIAENLSALEDAITQANKALRQLPSEVRSELERGFKNNMVQRNNAGLKRNSQFRYATPDNPTPRFWQSLQSILVHLETNLSSHQSPADIKYLGNEIEGLVEPFALAQETLLSLPNISPQAKTKQHWERVQLVIAARRLWESYRGEKPAEVPSSGEFLQFVSDLIAVMGKDWDAIDCCKAYRKRDKEFSASNVEK